MPENMDPVIFEIGGLNLQAVRVTAWLVGGALSGLIFLLARTVITGAAAFVPSALRSPCCRATAMPMRPNATVVVARAHQLAPQPPVLGIHPDPV